MLISNMIVKLGWSCFIAFDLKEAKNIIDTNQFELIISDLILPDSDAFETIEKIKALAPDSVIAAMTAGDTNKTAVEILAKARNDGAEFLLQKPFNTEKLGTILSNTLDLHKKGELKNHVLVVDDSKSMRSICQKLLEDKNYRVTLAESMNDAFEVIDVLDVDSILTDLNMPGMSVKEAIPYLHKNLVGVGIVAMTGESHASLSKLLELGADTALVKPFTPEALDLAIKKSIVMANSRLLQLLQNVEI